MSSLGTSNKSNIMSHWSESSGEPPEWSGMEHLRCEERLRREFVPSGCWGTSQQHPQCLWGGHQEDGAGTFRAGHGGRTREQQLQQEIPTWYKEKLFQYSQALLWAVSILGMAKALSNLVWFHSWPCSEHDVGLDTPWNPFQPELFNNSVLHLHCWDLALSGNFTGE